MSLSRSEPPKKRASLTVPPSRTSVAAAHSQGVNAASVKPMPVKLTDEEHARAKELFLLYDYDKSDSICRTELRDLLSELGIKLAETAVDALLAKAVTDDTKITFQEFCAVYKETISAIPTAQRKQQMSGSARLRYDDVFCNERAVRHAFKYYDFDSSGSLDRQELAVVLWDLGIPDVYGDNYSTMVTHAFTQLGDEKDAIDFHEFSIFVNMVLSHMAKLNEPQGKRY